MKTLALAPSLALPLDFATEGVAVIGMRGSGKSNTEVRWFELCHAAGIPCVAVDPKGDWGGIRSSSDGKRPGLPVPVFGGLSGDFPLDERLGQRIADLLVDKNLSAVLDVSRLSIGGRARFLTEFFDRLIDRHQREPHVRCVILEEAHRYIPQKVSGELARVKEAAAAILLEGRAFGLGCWAATQRPARLNKDVLEEVGTAIVHRIGAAATNDLRTVAGWVKHEDLGDEIVASLTKLKDGEAWVLAPSTLGISKRVQIDRRHTFDSAATPIVGAGSRPIVTLADIDSAAIKEALSDAIEKAKADDPKELHRRIRELERQLSERPSAGPVEVEVPVEVPTPVLDESLVIRIEEALSPVVALCAEIQSRLTWETTTRDEAIEFKRRINDRRADLPGARQSSDGARRGPGTEAAERPDPPRRREPGRSAVPRAASSADGAIRLGRRERRILSVLYQYPSGRSEDQLAFLTQYSAGSSTIGAGLSILRKAGLVEPGSPPRLTPEGVAHAETIRSEPLPTGPDLLAYWRSRLGKRERAFLDHLVSIHPDSTNHDELAEVTGYSREASTIGAGMSVLRKLEIADGWRASDDFMDAIR